MIHRLKISLGLAFAVACVVGMSAASASAAEFKTTTAKYPTTVSAKATNNQGFKITGAVTVCKKAEFAGTLAAAAPTLETSIEYTECKAQIGGLHNATVTPNGCTYVFHAAPTKTTEGVVDVKCPTGKEIVITVEGLTCKIKIPAQTGLKTIEYENSTPVATVKVNANVKAIKYTVETCPAGVESGMEGEYRKGNIILGPPEEVAIAPVSEPAKATAKGSPEPIEVS
jgi:hypothetical protein